MFDDDDAPRASEAQGIPALLGYALNVSRGVEHASDEAAELIAWLARNQQRLGLAEALFEPRDTVSNVHDRSKTRPISKQRWCIIRCALATRLRAIENSEDDDSVVKANPCSGEVGLGAVTAALGLDALDASLFGVVFRYQNDNSFERLFDSLAGARGRPRMLRRHPDLFALLVSADRREVSARFRADAPLVASGAIRVDEDGDIHLAERLSGLVHACGETGHDVRTELLGEPVKANLPWTAFRHLGGEIEVARAILGQALAAHRRTKPERGVHVLLYGPPGTGKSECAASLAAELGVRLHVIGERSETGREPSRAERLSDLLLAQRVGADDPMLYLFDEAEDLFRPTNREREPDPKIFVHRLLETARVPMIWAANELGAFSPAVLRRMSMCIEVKLPETSRRAELWQELAESEGVTMDAPTAERLAQMVPTAPSVSRTALRATRLAKGDAATVELVARGMAKAVGHGYVPPPELTRREEVYDATLSHADIELADLIARLTRDGAPQAISLLLSGPSGTGKSAFARHLAAGMGLKVLHKRGSDIFGMFVGQTERNIAAAFAEAREGNKFLIFDEADSLLSGRERAERNWEISQVNEMLTWMESHPLPFACTTNFPEALDKASLRRFLIRVNFTYLRPEQAARLFRLSFASEPPAQLVTLDRLTPADFTRISKRNTALGETPSTEALLALLRADAEGRAGTARAIGFGRSG